jgi:hypothetical protein
MMKKVLDLLKKPAVRHGLQVAFTVLAALAAGGKIDLSPLLDLVK